MLEATPPIKEMKLRLTRLGQIEASQLVSSVRQTVALNTHRRPAYPNGRG